MLGSAIRIEWHSLNLHKDLHLTGKRIVPCIKNHEIKGDMLKSIIAKAYKPLY